METEKSEGLDGGSASASIAHLHLLLIFEIING